MHIVKRSLQFVRGALLSYGPHRLKQRVWDREYRSEKWPMSEDTRGDCLYPHLQRYSNGGRILDLGCGSGNTAAELPAAVFEAYVGVDISEAALEMAHTSARHLDRTGKTRFERADFLSWEPSGEFDVILFRESLYHVPLKKLKPLLDRYARHLKPGGVLMIRLCTGCVRSGRRKGRPLEMLKIVEQQFELVEKAEYAGVEHPTVLVVRQRRNGKASAAQPKPSKHNSTEAA